MLWTPLPFLWSSNIATAGGADTRFASSIVVTSGTNPSNEGSSVTFTATITTTGSATGTVTFYDGASSLGTGAVSANVATLATSALTAGAHSITAIYGGDATHQSCGSSILTQNVNAVGGNGQFDFSDPNQSGELVLLEDI